MDMPRPLETHAEWHSADVADASTWTFLFSPSELDELDAALRHASTITRKTIDRDEGTEVVRVVARAHLERRGRAAPAIPRLVCVDRDRAPARARAALDDRAREHAALIELRDPPDRDHDRVEARRGQLETPVAVHVRGPDAGVGAARVRRVEHRPETPGPR